MKNINILALILSFILLIGIFSLLSIINTPSEIRFTWTGANPWNGVKGMMITIEHFLKTGAFLTYSIGLVLALFIWWRLYATVNRYLP